MRSRSAGLGDLAVAAIAGGVLVLAGNVVAEFTAFEWTLWAIEVILALSLVLVWGYCGIFSFGQAAVYGIGGYNGMTRIPRVTYRLPGGDPTTLTRVQFFAVCTCVALAVAVALRFAGRRPFGRIAAAVRENETRSSLLGYDVRRHKLWVFTFGGAIAGLAGGFYAAWGRFMSPTVFSLKPAALVVIWTLVGGRFSVGGAFVGVVVVEGLSSTLGGPSGDREAIVVGALLILIVLGLRGGVVPTLDRLWRDRLRPAVVGAGFGRVHRREATLAQSRSDARPCGEPEGGFAFGLDGDTDEPVEAAGALLEVRGVSKRFGGVTALEDVTPQFAPREASCIIGPNGAGKSTLFGVLTGYHPVTAGSILLNGEDITRLGPHRRARLGLGIKMQVPSVYGALTTLENLWLAAYAACGNRATAHRRAGRILARLGLSQAAVRPAGSLAHGQLQWLEIGMVLATEPSVILLDEPTAGMTRDETEQTTRLIARLAGHATVVVVEHDMEFVRRLDAPITVLHMGELFAQGSFDKLSRDERVLNIYLGRRDEQPAGRGDADTG